MAGERGWRDHRRLHSSAHASPEARGFCKRPPIECQRSADPIHAPSSTSMAPYAPGFTFTTTCTPLVQETRTYVRTYGIQCLAQPHAADMAASHALIQGRATDDTGVSQRDALAHVIQPSHIETRAARGKGMLTREHPAPAGPAVPSTHLSPPPKSSLARQTPLPGASRHQEPYPSTRQPQHLQTPSPRRRLPWKKTGIDGS